MGAPISLACVRFCKKAFRSKIFGVFPKKALMTVLVLMLVAVLVILVLPLLGLAAVMVAISLVVHAALGITVWLVGGQLLVAALIFAGAILAGVYYARRRPIDR